MRTIVNYLNNLFFPLIPESKGYGIKRFFLRLAGAQVGKNTKISSSVKIYGCGDLIIGENSWIGYQVTIVSSSKVVIGSYVDIAPNVYIGTGTHAVDVHSKNIAGEGISKDVKIGDGCWLCVNSTILPGVEIAKKTIVGAGAVVTKPFTEELIVLTGIPATKKKSLQ